MELKDRLNKIILTVQINHKNRNLVSIATNRIIGIVEEEVRKTSQQPNAADTKGRCGHVSCSHWLEGGLCAIDYKCEPLCR